LKPIETFTLLLILIAAIHLDVVHLPIRQGLRIFFEMIMEPCQALTGLVPNISVGAKLQATLMDVLTSAETQTIDAVSMGSSHGSSHGSKWI
jgi:hypothetical protein